MNEERTDQKMILGWNAKIPQGYVARAFDDSTHTMIVVPEENPNGQDRKPCPA